MSIIRKFRKIIEENLDDPSFGAPQLCRALGMSRAQLYRKVKALTDESVGYHISNLRLHKARELLETTEMNVSETAWAVGFKDLGHFSRSFREEFGVNPSEIR